MSREHFRITVVCFAGTVMSAIKTCCSTAVTSDSQQPWPDVEASRSPRSADCDLPLHSR